MNRLQMTRAAGAGVILVWAFVHIYYYASGRIDSTPVPYIKPQYLQVCALLGGLGLGILGIFNLMNLKAGEAACCGYDHDHDHGHSHDHKHEHGDCCGGEHGHEHKHEEPAHTHAHSHSHEHGGDCCGGGHGHEHSHTPKATVAHQHHHHHDHDHDHVDMGGDHEHEDTTLMGNVSMVVVLLVPLMLAAAFSNGNLDSPLAAANRAVVTDIAALQNTKSSFYGAPGSPSAASAAKAQPAQPVPGNTQTPPEAAPKDKWEYTLADLEKVVDRSADGNLMLTVDQFFYTKGDAELQRVLDGQPIEFEGQILKETGYNPDGKRMSIFTMMVTCCAADAMRVSVPVHFSETLPSIKEMSWVRVAGTVKYPVENGEKQSLLEVKSIQEIDEPVNYMAF